MKSIIEKFKNLKTSKKVILFVMMFLYVSILLFCFIKVNYTLITPGSLTRTTDFVTIDDEEYKNSAGQVFGTAVYTTTRISLFKYLVSKNKNDMTVYKYDPIDDMTIAEDDESGRLNMNQSSIKAIIAAYTLASMSDENIKISYSFKGMAVTNLYHSALKADLRIGDIIVSIAGHDVNTPDDYYNYRKHELLNENGKFDITVLRGEELINLEVEVEHKDDKYYATWYADEYYEIDEENTYPKFTVLSSTVQGPSSGLMQSLALYNMLTKDDVTKGKVIAGTGTININNDDTNYAGEIGSVELKIITASLVYNLDYFFVDAGDYEDALNAYNKLKNPKFTLISASSLNDVINFLAEVE